MADKNSTNRGLGYIDTDLCIEGSVHSQKKMVVSGTVCGSVSGNQEIVVSETGHVLGKIEGNKILIAYEPVWSIGTGVLPKNYELDNNINYN